MRVLVVKLTSMGDALHLLPALSDLQQHHPDVIVDWMIEESFTEIPAWHRSVDKVIPVATRRWRKFRWSNIRQFFSFLGDLREHRYDFIIDAQGLMKSAVFARMARKVRGGTRVGFSGDSIKESPAAWLYGERIDVPRKLHAIPRLRQLLADGFDYPAPATDTPEAELDYALSFATGDTPPATSDKQLLFFHGTTWQSKHLPDFYWQELADLAGADGYQVLLPWGSEAEKTRAKWIAEGRPHVTVLARKSLAELAGLMTVSSGAIAVDTGLAHMAAALGLPTVSIYGATDADLTGALGARQVRLQSHYQCSPCLLKTCNKLNERILDTPCYLLIKPPAIWQALLPQLSQSAQTGV